MQPLLQRVPNHDGDFGITRTCGQLATRLVEHAQQVVSIVDPAIKTQDLFRMLVDQRLRLALFLERCPEMTVCQSNAVIMPPVCPVNAEWSANFDDPVQRTCNVVLALVGKDGSEGTQRNINSRSRVRMSVGSKRA